MGSSRQKSISSLVQPALFAGLDAALEKPSASVIDNQAGNGQSIIDTGRKPRIILGIDGGFAGLGWAAAELLGDGPRLRAVGIIRTKPGERSLKTEDNAERTRVLFNGLCAVQAKFPTVAAIAVESQSWPRVPIRKPARICPNCQAEQPKTPEEESFVNPATCGQLGMSFGAIFSFAALWELSLIQQSPQRIKKLTTGGNSATKEAVRLGLQQMRGFEGLEAMLHAAGIPSSYWEHPVDAAAAIYAALDTELGRTLRSLAA